MKRPHIWQQSQIPWIVSVLIQIYDVHRYSPKLVIWELNPLMQYSSFPQNQYDCDAD